MASGPKPQYLLRLDELTDGYSVVLYGNKKWGATKTTFTGGRSTKFYAEALDGSDFISLNLYRTRNGPKLKPCEMPAEKVIDFLKNYICFDQP
ncbi:peptide methionine sulfoxide reductase [Lewinellaceae bacterium SD302]|nr:peptide methionine sulfoxide reductase [Lewinellaceae bacterium SD302]